MCNRSSQMRPSNSPKGTVRGETQSYSIYDNDQLMTAEPYNDVIIAYRNGGPIRIRDIGRAVEGPGDTTLRVGSARNALSR